MENTYLISDAKVKTMQQMVLLYSIPVPFLCL